MRRLLTVVAVVSMAVITACSGGSSKTQPTGTPTPDPRQGLAALAAAGTRQTYAATYRLSAGNRTGQLLVALTPPHYRLLITVGSTMTEFLYTSKGIYTCGRVKRWECFSIPRTGHPVPRVVDPLIENVFTLYPTGLARHTKTYNVTLASSMANATCYAVSPTGSSPAPIVPAGTYCFNPHGIPMSAQFTGGGRLTFVRFDKLPSQSAFVPPAKPTPLPR